MRSGKLGPEGALFDFSVSERLALPRFAAAKVRHSCELCKAVAGAGQILKSQQPDTQRPSLRSTIFSVQLDFLRPFGRICNPTALNISICNAINGARPGLKILIFTTAGLQIQLNRYPARVGAGPVPARTPATAFFFARTYRLMTVRAGTGPAPTSGNLAERKRRILSIRLL